MWELFEEPLYCICVCTLYACSINIIENYLQNWPQPLCKMQSCHFVITLLFLIMQVTCSNQSDFTILKQRCFLYGFWLNKLVSRCKIKPAHIPMRMVKYNDDFSLAHSYWFAAYWKHVLSPHRGTKPFWWWKLLIGCGNVPPAFFQHKGSILYTIPWTVHATSIPRDLFHFPPPFEFSNKTAWLLVETVWNFWLCIQL